MQTFSLTDSTPSAAARVPAGYITMFADGTFDGTVQLQCSPDGNTWFDVPDASLTAKGLVNISVNAPLVRVVNTGAAPTVTCWLSVV